MLKYPALKTSCPTLVSNQGAGKGELILINRAVMGDAKILETTKPEEDVWGKFNCGMLNAFLVICDELDRSKCKDAIGVIKGLITNEDGLKIEMKGKDRVPIKSYHRFMNASNSPNPVFIEDSNRRFVIVRSSDELVAKTPENVKYHDKMRVMVKDDVLMVAVGDWLTNLADLENFHTAPIPETDYQKEVMRASRKIEEQFFEDWLADHKHDYKVVEVLTVNEMYMDFKIWKNTNGISYDKQSSAFMLNLVFLKNKFPVGSFITSSEDSTLHTRLGNSVRLNFKLLRKFYNISFDGCLIPVAADDESDDESKM